MAVHSMDEQAPRSRPMMGIDWLIVALILCAVLLTFVPTGHREQLESAVTALAVVGCALLLSWMWFADGAHSAIWGWLPPFWPWGRYAKGTISRWIIVVLLVLGTVVGIISDRVAR